MAGAGYKLFNTGDVLTAAQVNTYLMEQTVMVFADAAARTTALTGVVSEGMISYLKDTNAVEVYNGSAWVASDDPNAIQNTIINAKGDLIAGSANDTPAILSVGNSGETIVADSAATTGLRYNPSPTIAQPVVNGGMDIWRRGTSFSFSATENKYTADRWFGRTYGNVSTFSRQNTSDTTNLPFIQYCYRMARDSGQTSTQPSFVGQSFETSAISPFNGKTITVSFYARKGADLSGTFKVFAQTGTGTEANVLTSSFTTATNIIEQTLTLTTTWQRFSYTGTVGTGVTQFAVYFRHDATGTAGAADYAEFTGIQIDVGNTALPFRRTGGTLQGERSSCERYFQLIASGDNQTVFNGAAYDSSSIYGVYNSKVTMRTSPTISIVSGSNYYKYWGNNNGGVGMSAVALDNASPQGVRMNQSGLTVTQGYAYWVMTANASAFVALQAEL